VKGEELRPRKRDILGKKVRSLRHQGLTPANLYGPKTKSIPLQIETPFLERLIARVGRNAIVTLRIDGKPRLAMIRDIQRDALTGTLLHVGFFQVEATHKVTVEIPLAFHGEAPATKSSRAMLIHNLTSLHMEGLPADLPRNIEVDLSGLKEIGQAIHVREIPIDDRLEVLTDPDEVVAYIEEVRAPVEEVKVKAEVREEAPPEAEKEEEAE